MVGHYLLPRLVSTGADVWAYSRAIVPGPDWRIPGVRWQHTDGWRQHAAGARIVSLMPVWATQQFMAAMSVKPDHVVALSSTSRYTKVDSAAPRERELAQCITAAEAALQAATERDGPSCTLLRCTLVYDGMRDRNITRIAQFMRCMHFFPLCGDAAGLRQPLHADDVASACMAALSQRSVRFRAYDLSGGETLSYRAMATKIFAALDMPPRFIRLHPGMVRILASLFGAGMLAILSRMNVHLVVDHAVAMRELGFTPRPFTPDFISAD